jgi:sulfur carrier protein ThiS
MPQATFWFASPFKDWIGRRTLTLSWDGETTLRGVFIRLAAEYPRLRENLAEENLEEAMANRVAVILNGDFLSLDSIIPDGARVDVLTPLSGGAPSRINCLLSEKVFTRM